MKTLTKLTLPIVQGCLRKNNEIEAKLFMHWSKIENNYKNKTFPKKVIFFKNKTNNGTLILNVQYGPGLEIQMNLPKILNSINNFLGYKAIKEIKIKQIDLKKILY